MTQYHTFSGLSGVSLGYRSEAHLSKKPCGLHFTKDSLELMLVRCEHRRVQLLYLNNLHMIYLDYPKSSRVPDLYRKARPN
jgi:hypothetical protein